MLNKLVHLLTYSHNKVLQGLFSYKANQWQYMPEVNRRIIEEAEARFFGPCGLPASGGGDFMTMVRRSAAQYFCQEALVANSAVHLTRQLIVSVALPFLLAFVLTRTFISCLTRPVQKCDVVALAQADRHGDIVRHSFPDAQVRYIPDPSPYLGFRELGFASRVFYAKPSLLLQPVFLQNFLRWLSVYGGICRFCRPHTVAAMFEGVVSSSLMTAYLRERGCRHVNIMHGERLYFAGHAFCVFDEFHVWGEYFRGMFASMKHPEESLKVVGSPLHRRIFHDLRHLAQPRSRETLIVHNMILMPGSLYYINLLKLIAVLDGSWSIKVRFHPAQASHGLAFQSALSAETVLAERGVRLLPPSAGGRRLEDDVAGAMVVVGGHSTAMIEAWIGGCKILYLKGELETFELVERFGGSENVLLFDGDPAPLGDFLRQGFVFSPEEDRRVDRLTSIT